MSESEKYEILEKIGHGSFGIIRKVRRRTDGMVLCRKEISYLKMSQKEREQLHAEFQILSTLRHPNIVGYYHREHLKASQDLHLYMEYCGNGDLGRVIRSLQDKNQYAEESFVWSIFSQLVTALYRCHYGVDPPEVGKAVLGLGSTARPKPPTGGMTILHRDLKPENVFLGEDNSVKLGDFGLSKVMQSHDFASTYVGTPFYMSPEICAAEKYTLKSDIWSLGCIIYELCTREPPFNAKTHFQLVQKIKEGKIAPLPAIYSAELFAIIKDCLRVNPDRRPDTAMLLNLPVVRLMRKEKEVVEFSRTLKAKEEAINRRMRDLDQKLATLDQDKASMRHEIDASLRREWEVKARLEIDRLVGQEIEQLQRKFDHEVRLRVDAEVQQFKRDEEDRQDRQDLRSSVSRSEYPYSSIGSQNDAAELSAVTDMSELSGEESPSDVPTTTAHTKKSTTNLNTNVNPNARTPFGRAQTMYAMAPAGTPMDIEMASPSPIAIASLSLSPRRHVGTKAPVVNPGNIFTAQSRWTGREDDEAAGRGGSDHDNLGDDDHGLVDDLDDDDDDDMPLPSPTRMIKSIKNPFLAKGRPQLHAQKSMPVHRVQSKPSQPGLTSQGKTIPVAASTPDLHTARSAGDRSGTTSPSRRLSKIPSAASLKANNSGNAHDGQLNSKPSMGNVAGGKKENIINDSHEQKQQPQQQQQQGSNANSKSKTQVRGRTLVELQQARAGGRPLSAVYPSEYSANMVTGGSAPQQQQQQPPTVNTGVAGNASPMRAFREHAAAANRGAAAVWDPETDDMPSPFIVRRKPIHGFGGHGNGHGHGHRGGERGSA
ncbi:kinase-like domain-containing protein [Chaetomium sp. MPI-SDFR-AT-0129]|nr:kinase-like domain-containing protein [Chaetomium sp. MPI-SDFR-AT-0129]